MSMNEFMTDTQMVAVLTRSRESRKHAIENYRSNVRPRLRLADLLTEVVILQLRRGSEQ